MSYSIDKIIKPREARPATTVEDAEFSSKKWVWLPDSKRAFIKGFITKEVGDQVTVRCDDNSDRTVAADTIDKVNPPQFDKANDMAELTYLNEASVVNNLLTRYITDSIYTYSGLFLVAVNPYKSLPIYDKDTVQAYKNKQRDEVPPHIYSISDQAFRNMLEMFENQSILVTGESGAGKTENTKKVIQYLAAITSSSGQSRPNKQGTSFERQILQANPILESFGNAQTVRNNNSSRFGKFIRIEFSRSGQIAGASIDWYLLEKSRVIQQNPRERNYHIFYQLLSGANKKLKQTLMLEGTANSYNYLKSSNKKVVGIDDEKEFKDLLESFKIMGLAGQDQNDLFRIMAAILHIGNIQIGSETSDQGRILNVAQIEKVAHLLGINSDQFMKSLLRPKVKAGREWVTQSRSAEQIRMSLDALSKSLYERTFSHIVDRINQTLERTGDSSLYIGVLDIAGFEIFEHNSFEQLCINYTNEKLQQFFNHHMFILEQEEYSRENIDWKFIDFGHDLKPIIDLIEKPNPMGIFSCLDEDCVMPKATDKSFTEKLNQLWSKKSKKFTSSKLTQGFILTHYAADVEYSTEGWLEKNKDPLNDNVVQQLVESSEALVRGLFESERAVAESARNNGARVKKGLFRTVAQRHKEHLNHLMDQLNSTHPHFVRCIIPNHDKKPREFDNLLVLDQLRCNGVLEGIRIARTGFPNRLPFSEFRLRYEVLAPDMPKGYVDGQTACNIILKKLGLDDNLYKVGLTKVFFKSGVLADLEERRESIIRNLIVKFQNIARGALVRARVKRNLFKSKATMIIQKNLEVYLKLKEDPWWKLYVKMKPLLIASRETGHSKMRDSEFKKLEQSVKEYEAEKIKMEETSRKAEQELERVSNVLERERALALDKEEILKRAQAKEADLQEQLTTAYDDLDKLEAQCDELIDAKKNIDAQASLWKKELTTGAGIIGMLEAEKTELKKQISVLEGELSLASQKQESENLEAEKLMKELKFLKSCISQRDQKIAELEESIKRSDSEIEIKLNKANARYESASRNIQELVQENKEARSKLKELNQVSAEYEDLVKKKESELASLKKELEIHLTRVQSIDREKSTLQEKYLSLTTEVAAIKNEKDILQKKHASLEKEAKKSRELLEAKISESVKHSQGRALLDQQIDSLKRDLDEKEQLGNSQLLKFRGELEAKQKQIDRLLKAKDQLLETSQKLELSENDVISLRKDLELEMVKTREVKSLQQQISDLKDQLQKADTAKAQLSLNLSTISAKLSQSQEKSFALSEEVERFRKEGRALEDEISKMRRQQLAQNHDLEALEMEKTKAIEELENRKKDISNILLGNKKLKDEVEQKSSQMDKLRASITAEVEKRIQKLIEEKNSLETSSKKLKLDLESINVKYNTVDRQKQKLTQEIEDLGHDLVREQKTAAAAESIKSTLVQQLEKLKNATEVEKRNRSEREVEKRKLAAALETAKKELEERTKQLLALQKVVRPKSTLHSNPDNAMNETPELVDLAVRLEESEKKRKKAEETRALIQDQLDDAKKRWSKELDSQDSKYYASRRALLDELANISTATPPVSPTKRGLSTFGTRRSVASERTLTEDKENIEKDFSGKSREELQETLENLQKTKNDLLSVYHETSKNLVQTREELSESQRDKARLEKQIARGGDSANSTELADMKMHIEVEIAKSKELAASMKLYKSRSEEYYRRLEQAENIVLKATRAETFAKTQQLEAEETLKRTYTELQASEKTITSFQSAINKLEGELEEKNIDLKYFKESHERASIELDGLRSQRSQDMNKSQYSVEAMRSRYAEEIRSMSAELETEKLKNSELETSQRRLQREFDEIKSKDAMLNSGINAKSRADYESKVEQLIKANEESTLAYNDSQMRIGSLLSQVKNLRSTMGDITSERDQLQKDKRTLEQRLNETYQRYEELAASVNDPGTLSRQKSMLGGQLRTPDDAVKQINDLKIALSNQTGASATVLEQLRRTKQQLVADQDAIERERRFNRELKKVHEKEKQALNLKVVDLEARMLALQSDGATFYKDKVADLEKQLAAKEQSYIDDLRQSRSADRSVKDLYSQMSQKDKQIQRLQGESQINEQKISKLKWSLENTQAEESAHRIAARRAEREARDAKERALQLEKDFEDWKQRSSQYGAKSFV